MSATVNTPARDAAGRFVKRGRRTKRATTERSTTGSAEVRRTRHSGVRPIAILTLAIVLGVAGFAFAVFWIGALVVMGILWGTMAADRRQPADGDKGLLAEVVEVVIDETKNVAESARASTQVEHEQ